MLRVVKVGALVLGGVFVALQLVPYGRDHHNPAVTVDAPWGSDEGRRLARAACYDCHSNETHWPWYSNVAPLSWLVQRDVDQGRSALNFSEWDVARDKADDLHDAVEDGDMPPSKYLLLHPDAKLSAGEKSALIDALQALERADRGGDRSGPNRGPG